MSKRSAPPAPETDENKPRAKGGSGYIGRRKEHRFEDVGDAKDRLLKSLAGTSHVGGKAVVGDSRVWCPEGWTARGRAEIEPRGGRPELFRARTASPARNFSD